MDWQPERDPYDDRAEGPARRIARALTWSLPLFTVFGIRIRVHWFLVLWALYFAGWTNLQGSGVLGVAAQLGWGVFLTAILYGLVLLHELGHAGAAAMNGIGTSSIVLNPLGGLAMVDEPARGPAAEAQIAMAGPAVNWFIVALSAGVVAMTGLPETPWTPFSPTAALGFAIWANAIMGVFNLIPAYPLDGGRVLRAVLSWRRGSARGTVWACRTGEALSVGMIALGLYGGGAAGWVLAGIGVFCIIGCEQAIYMVRIGLPVYTEPLARDFLPAPDREEARERRHRREEEEIDRRLDALLDKVAREGLGSLSRAERTFLKKASRHYRRTKT